MDLLFQNVSGVEFTDRADAVPYNYRISYKIAQLCLIISKTCRRGGGCSILKLHLISIALKSRTDMDSLIAFSDNKLYEPLPVRFDPSINRAINYGLADGFLAQQVDGKYKLTDNGKHFASVIDSDSELMIREKELLSLIGSKLSEGRIKELMSTWRYSNASDK